MVKNVPIFQDRLSSNDTRKRYPGKSARHRGTDNDYNNARNDNGVRNRNRKQMKKDFFKGYNGERVS